MVGRVWIGLVMVLLGPVGLWVGRQIEENGHNAAVLSTLALAAGSLLFVAGLAVAITDHEVWWKELAGTNTRAVALFNRGSGSASITVQWSQIGLPAGVAQVRDLWAKQDLAPATNSYTASNVPSHGVVMLKVVGAP